MSKVWLVTGSSRGLGRELAQAVLGAGHRLVATARDPRHLAFLPPSDRLRTVALDVTDGAAARAAVGAATSAFGSLDVVVHNAGYIKADSVEDQPEDEFRRQFEINFFGVYNVTRAVLPVMHAQRDGHIIQISSIGGRVGGTPGLSAYQTAKFGVEGFSEVLANEVAPLGIKVIIVEPGGIRTGWAAGAAVAPGSFGADYEPTVGAWTRRFAQFSGVEPGDPALMAQAIVEVVGAPEPPRRLLLGSDALALAVDAERGRLIEADTWADVSRSTDLATAS